MKKIAIPLLLSLLAATACWPFSTDALGEMKVKRDSDSGRVAIVRGSQTIAVTAPTPVQVGDVVSTSGGALASLHLVGNDFVRLAADTEVRIDSTHGVEGPLHTGSLVAQAGDAMDVKFGGVMATSSNGVFRIDKGIASVRAGAYSGNVRLATPGQPRVELSRLFEVQAAASDLRAREPYRLENGDAWDRVYLKPIVALDQDLTPLARGLRTQLGSSRPDLAYFRTLAGQNVDFMKRYLPRPTIDLLTAFVIANHSPGSLKSDFTRAFRLFDQGAEWAVVAGILKADFHPLVAQLTNIAAATGAVAGGTGNAAVFSVAAANAVNNTAPGGTAVPPANGAVAGPAGGQGGEPPAAGGGGGPPQSSPTPPDCGDSVSCAANDANNTVNKIKPSPTPSGLLEGINGGPKN